jgi:hypothetical protein
MVSPRRDLNRGAIDLDVAGRGRSLIVSDSLRAPLPRLACLSPTPTTDAAVVQNNTSMFLPGCDLDGSGTHHNIAGVGRILIVTNCLGIAIAELTVTTVAPAPNFVGVE